MRWIILPAAAALALASGAAAQPRASGVRPNNACAQGKLTRIRVSKIKAGGSMAGFRDAVSGKAEEHRVAGTGWRPNGRAVVC